MARAVTAIYRTHATAALVRDEIAGLGVSSGDIHVLPDRTEGFEPGAERDLESFNRELHDIGLPDDELRGYQSALKRGDHVVSVEVTDDAHLDRILEVMRHPEAHDMDALDAEFRDAEYVPMEPAPATGPAAAGMGGAATGVVAPAPAADPTPPSDPSAEAHDAELRRERARMRRDEARREDDPRTRTYLRDEA